MKRSHDIVQVEWEDHCDVGGVWNTVRSIKKQSQPVTIVSVGTVIYENKKVLVISPGIVKGGNTVATATLILKSCITKRKTIKKGNK